MTDEDWVNKARDARNHHVRSGNDNCDKCYYEAVGHRSNIIKHFFSDEYIHSQFHKCPNENCDVGYCTLQSLITHADIIHNGNLRKSLDNQNNTGGIFYWIIPKTKEILSPLSLSTFFPTSLEKLTPKKDSNSENIGNVTRTSQEKLSIESRKLSTSSSFTHQTISTKSERFDTCSNNIPKDQLRDYDSEKHSKKDTNARTCKNIVDMPTTPFTTTTTALDQNILAPVNMINMINSHLILKTSNLAGKIESIDVNNGESNQRSKRQRSRNKGTFPKAPGQRSLKNGQRCSQRRSSTTFKEFEEIKNQMKNLETLLKEFDGIKDMILGNALLGHQCAKVSTQGTQTENTEEIFPLDQISSPLHLDDKCLQRWKTLEDQHNEFTLLDRHEDEDDESKKMKYQGIKCHSAEENHDNDYIVLTTTTSGMSPFQQRRRMRRSFFYREGSQWGF